MVGYDSCNAGFLAALETLGRDPGSPANCPSNRAHQYRCAHLDLPGGTVNGRIGVGRSRLMNRDGFEGSHLPDHAFFGAAKTWRSDPDGPHTRNLVEMPRGTSGMSDRTLAAELVKAPPFSVPFVAESKRETAGIKVRPPRTIFVDHSIVGELRTA